MGNGTWDMGHGTWDMGHGRGHVTVLLFGVGGWRGIRQVEKIDATVLEMAVGWGPGLQGRDVVSPCPVRIFPAAFILRGPLLYFLPWFR